MIKSLNLSFTYPLHEDVHDLKDTDTIKTKSSQTPLASNFSTGATPIEDQPRTLDDITINICGGEFVAICGHNGSGKSTLARHFNALLMPTSGTLWINGLDSKDLNNLWDIRQSTGMVFQNPDNQIIATVVEEDVAFGPENLGVDPAEIRARVDEMLDAVSMRDYAKSAPYHLSGGQKQRVAIAGVLAMKPSCIVLDEPTAMLDPSGRREVMKTIKRLNREQEITIILITHYMEEAAQADRIIVMEKGRVVMDDHPKAVFSHEREMERLKLGVPAVTSLAHALRHDGILIADDIINVEEFLKDPAYIKLLNHLKPSGTNVMPTLSEKNEDHSPATNPIIELKNLTHIYGEDSVFEKKAVDDVNLNIYPGEIIAIIGHTGSGKSTLIQHLNALLKPTHGTVFIDGENIFENKKHLKETRRKVGLVFQYPEHQLFEETVYKDVAFGPERMGLSKEAVDQAVRDALALVGISEENFEKSPFELSGGQKRRVAIAGVLAMKPQILILDEPAAGLDPSGREKILSQIKQMHDRMGLTVILVSHSMDDAAQLASRILVMNEGRIALDGIPEEIFIQTEYLKSIGLDVPQLSYLMSFINKEANVPKTVFTVEKAAEVIMQIREGKIERQPSGEADVGDLSPTQRSGETGSWESSKNLPDENAYECSFPPHGLTGGEADEPRNEADVGDLSPTQHSGETESWESSKNLPDENAHECSFPPHGLTGGEADEPRNEADVGDLSPTQRSGEDESA